MYRGYVNIVAKSWKIIQLTFFNKKKIKMVAQKRSLIEVKNFPKLKGKY